MEVADIYKFEKIPSAPFRPDQDLLAKLVEASSRHGNTSSAAFELAAIKPAPLHTSDQHQQPSLDQRIKALFDSPSAKIFPWSSASSQEKEDQDYEQEEGFS